jgi:hypothetical protein
VRRVLLLLAVVLVGAAPAATAQAGARVELTRDTVSNDPIVRVRNLLREPQWREALEAAFTLRLQWRVDLWRQRTIFPANERTVNYEVIVQPDPLLRQYRLITRVPGRPPIESRYSSFESLQMAMDLAQQLGRQGPTRSGEWYYTATLRVSTLTDEELAELQAFVGGGDRGSPGSAITRAFLRLIALPTTTLDDRSETFRVP